jgi:flotillin
MTTIMYVSAILAVVIILTIIGVLSRYRRCKPNQVLVVYGKTGGEKKSAKLYHGGAAFVLPIIQSYDVLSMEPMQIKHYDQCHGIDFETEEEEDEEYDG